MKKIFSFILSFAILASLFAPSSFAEEGTSTKGEDIIQQRLDEIDSKYKVGEPFSPGDAAFIKAQAKLKSMKPETKPGEITTQARKSLYINKAGGAGNLAANMNGYVWGNMGYVNHSYGAYFSTKVTKGNATKITNSVYTSAYGAVGSTGVIGLIYSGKETDYNTGQNYLYSDMYDSYSGLAIYQRVYAKTVVTNGTYTFTIRSADL